MVLCVRVIGGLCARVGRLREVKIRIDTKHHPMEVTTSGSSEANPNALRPILRAILGGDPDTVRASVRNAMFLDGKDAVRACVGRVKPRGAHLRSVFA